MARNLFGMKAKCSGIETWFETVIEEIALYLF